MVDFKGRNEIPVASVPKPPNNCDCGKLTDVLSITVYDDRGQTHAGPFSKYGYKKSTGQKTSDYTLHLLGDYTYAHWTGLCTDCHTKIKPDWREVLIAKERAAHPERERQAGESMDAFAKRSIQFMREKMGMIGRG